MQMRIDVVDWQLNAIGPEQAGVWIKPDYSGTGVPNVDLADPNLQFQIPAQPLSGAAMNPRANGGLRTENAGWSAAPQTAQPDVPSARMRLGQRFAPRQAVSTAPAGAVVAPPVVELPSTNNGLR